MRPGGWSARRRRGFPFLLVWLVVARGAVAQTPTPRRVVALAPSAAEIVFALGAADRVVGVSEFAKDLPEAKGKTVVGGFTPDLERIAALAPDLIVVSRDGTDKGAYEKLLALKYRVVVTDATTLAGVLVDIENVARALGAVARGKELIASLSKRIADAEKRRPAPGKGRSALVVIWPEPPVVAGRKTFIGDLLDRAGIRNVTPDAAGEWPRVSHETLAGWNPDVVIRPETPENDQAFRSAFATDPRWAVVPAVKKGRVVAIPGSLLERPGPRLVEALELLVALPRE